MIDRVESDVKVEQSENADVTFVQSCNHVIVNSHKNDRDGRRTGRVEADDVG